MDWMQKDGPVSQGHEFSGFNARRQNRSCPVNPFNPVVPLSRRARSSPPCFGVVEWSKGWIG
jgi:hypothetical protein